MNRVELVERLLSELATARAAIAANYERLWPAAERALRASSDDEPQKPPARGAGRAADDGDG